MIRKNKHFKAFTLTETLIVMSILGVIVALTAFSTLTSGEIRTKRIVALSNSFFSNVENSYQGILLKETFGGTIVNIDNNPYDAEADSKKLRDIYAKYLEGENIDCSKLVVNSDIGKNFKKDELQCIITNQKIIAGIYLNRNCSDTYQIKEYYNQNSGLRIVENVCGYILYATPDSRGIYGNDVFTIALGKVRIK